MKFRKKPIVIEFFADGQEVKLRNRPILIETLEGVVTAQIGDWIIKGIRDEFYPCKPDIFELDYEKMGRS